MKAMVEKFPKFPEERVFDKKYRGFFEIIASILEVAVEGVSRYAIANCLHTNYVHLQKYLNYLVRRGFIDVEVDGGRLLYRTSGKGLEFLKLYYALLKMFLEKDTEASMCAGVIYGLVDARAKRRGRRSLGL